MIGPGVVATLIFAGMVARTVVDLPTEILYGLYVWAICLTLFFIKD